MIPNFSSEKEKGILERKEKVEGTRNLTSGPSLEGSVQLPLYLAHRLFHRSLSQLSETRCYLHCTEQETEGQTGYMTDVESHGQHRFRSAFPQTRRP